MEARSPLPHLLPIRIQVFLRARAIPTPSRPVIPVDARIRAAQDQELHLPLPVARMAIALLIQIPARIQSVRIQGHAPLIVTTRIQALPPNAQGIPLARPAPATIAIPRAKCGTAGMTITATEQEAASLT